MAVLAAVDIGSNSIKMTVAWVNAAGPLEEFAWASETVRLGTGVEQTGRLADDRVEAALSTLVRFAEEARRHGAASIHAVATEATRAAANGELFLERVRREAGIDVRVIDGDQEAALTFRGLSTTIDLRGNLIVADVGGGSTELIVAADGNMLGARSLPLGSGRLTERFVGADPPVPSEIAACRQAAADVIIAAAASLPLPVGPADRLVVVGGTGEYLARLAASEHALIRADIEAVLAELSVTSAADLAARLSITEARARVLPGGVAIIAAVADHLLPVEIEIARSGIRAGLLLAVRDHGLTPSDPTSSSTPPERF